MLADSAQRLLAWPLREAETIGNRELQAEIGGGPDVGPPEHEELAGLTEQERKILALIAEGMTNRQIGERLYLAEKTVKNYVSSILSKLGLERRTQAAVFASRLLRD